ncbi:MAG TPA: hypothetical protein VFS83_17640 [Ktedonobacterales bacterium]|nr:hypothetical protein [Ktedonobacterales bacterium]
MQIQTLLSRALRHLMLAMLAAGFAVVFVACGASTGAGSVHDVASLADHLRAQGAQIEMGSTIKHPFLAIPGQIMTVNGQDIEVFQYANAQALANDTRTIDPDGCIGTVGGSMLDPWTAPPHFFKSQGVMIIYLGSDAKMLQLLTNVMGKQFAGE